MALQPTVKVENGKVVGAYAAQAKNVGYKNNQSVEDALDELNTKVPAPPSSNGTYKLTCVVSGGVTTYSWVSV